MKTTLLFPIVALCFGGCQTTLVHWKPMTYTPVAIANPEQAATLTNKRYDVDIIGEYGYNLCEVDGKSVRTAVRRDQLVRLNPGEHRVEIQSYGGEWPIRQRLTFTAEPGGRYEADGKDSGRDGVIAIRSVPSHKIVSVSATGGGALFLHALTAQPQDLLGTMVAFAAAAQASKQAPAVARDTAVLFPSRSQAIALGLLTFRGEKNAWPASKDELREFFDERFKEAAPPAPEFGGLRLENAPDDKVAFGFARPGLADERYLLSPDGTISFALTPGVPVPGPRTAIVTAPVAQQPSGFPWGELAARLLVEVTFRLLSEHRK